VSDRWRFILQDGFLSLTELRGAASLRKGGEAILLILMLPDYVPARRPVSTPLAVRRLLV